MNVQTVNFKNISFVSVTNPGSLEIKYLKNNFGFDTLHLDDYANKTQVPKIEVFKNYTLLVLDFPFFGKNSLPSIKTQDKTTKTPIEALLNIPQVTLSPLVQFPNSKKRRLFSIQVDFFIGKDYLVVLHDGVLSPINDIFSVCQKTLQNRNEYLGEGPVFLAYRIIDALVDNCFPVINDIAGTIDKIDKELEQKYSQSTLENISLTRRNIVVFQTMIKPILPLFKQLEDGKYSQLNGSMQPFWSNVLDHLQKIWDRLEDSRELIEGISTSSESLLTSRTNEIIKVLTIFSTIILPLNLFASIYGMNIKGLPLANDVLSFIFLMLFMFVTALFMLIIFKYKGWF